VEATTSLSEIVADLDDEKLQKLARPPADRLFPLLRHAAAMRPLVVLAALIPALLVLPGTQMNAARGMLSLRTLDLMGADATDLLQVESSYSQLLLPHTAPLTAWMEVAWLDLFGTAFDANFVITQFLSIAAIVALAFTIGHRLGGMRMGMFSCLLLCCQPQILWSAQFPGLGPLPIAMALVCFWSVHKLWEEQLGSFSITQFLAGTSAALCALSGGPLILALVVCLILNRLAWDALLWRQDHTSATQNKRRRILLRGWKSLAIIAGYMAVLSGWWFVWMLGGFGPGFVQEWFAPLLGGDKAAAATDWGAPVTAQSRFQFFPGIMSGLVLLGAWHMIREAVGISQAGRESHRTECIWLLAWSSTAILFWGIAEWCVGEIPPYIEIWRLFLIVPVTMIAAWGVVEIADRKIPLVNLLLVAALSILVSLVQIRDRWGDRESLLQTATLILCVIAISPIIGWKLLRWSRNRDRRERQLLSLITVLLIGLTIVDGLSTVPRSTATISSLQSLSKELSGIRTIDRLVFASPFPIAPELEYAVRGRWPYLPVSHVRDWNSGMAAIVQHRSSGGHSAGELLICWDISESNRLKDLLNPVVVVPAVPVRIFREKELNIFRCESTSAAAK